MSRTINDSVQLLTETLGNCKTALTEKQVADVDNIKISDVDEKIAEITAGGSSSTGGFYHIKDVSYAFKGDTQSTESPFFLMCDDHNFTLKITFTTKDEEGLLAKYTQGDYGFSVEPSVSDDGNGFGVLKSNTTYTFTLQNPNLDGQEKNIRVFQNYNGSMDSFLFMPLPI